MVLHHEYSKNIAVDPEVEIIWKPTYTATPDVTLNDLAFFRVVPNAFQGGFYLVGKIGSQPAFA